MFPAVGSSVPIAAGPLASDRAVVRVDLVVASLAVAQVESADPAAQETLAPADLARLARLRHPADRARLVGGRRLVRELVARGAGVAPETVRVAPDARGRLHVEGPRLGHTVSVAHAGAAIGVALAVGGRVGLDLEPVSDGPVAGAGGASARRALETIALTPAERAELDELPTPVRDDRLLRAWTVKEAYAKLVGRGLGLDVAAVSLERIGGRRGLAVRTLIVGLGAERYRVAIAVWSPAHRTSGPDLRPKPAIELSIELRPAATAADAPRAAA